MNIEIRQATSSDVDLVSSILLEAAAWLAGRQAPMWRADELRPERIASDVEDGLFHIALFGNEPAGTIKFQLADPEFWPDLPADDSAYVHRLAVRRRHAGGLVSAALMTWAVGRAAAMGRRFLRLDCEASRQRLRALYERLGFAHHSDRRVGPYFVARYQLAIGDHALATSPIPEER